MARSCSACAMIGARRRPSLSLWERVDRTAKRFRDGVRSSREREPSNPSSVAGCAHFTTPPPRRRKKSPYFAAPVITSPNRVQRSPVKRIIWNWSIGAKSVALVLTVTPGSRPSELEVCQAGGLLHPGFSWVSSSPHSRSASAWCRRSSSRTARCSPSACTRANTSRSRHGSSSCRGRRSLRVGQVAWRGRETRCPARSRGRRGAAREKADRAGVRHDVQRPPAELADLLHRLRA